MLRVEKWSVTDAEFILSVRNNKDLRKWFKQDKDISIEQQRNFIVCANWYGGKVIKNDNELVGICNVKNTGEFGIAILPKYQGKGYAKEVMNGFMPNGIWSEVFVDNPALSFYLWKCGFKATGVKERAYYKDNFGWKDTIVIKRI